MDRERLAAIFHQQAPRLVRWARRFVSDHDVAEDVVQNVFFQLLHHTPTTNEDAYILTAVANECKDWLKDIRRDEESYEEDEALSPWRGPFEQLLAAELGRDILCAMRSLTPHMQHAFLRHHVDGVEYETIAEELGLSVGAAKMHAYRARFILQRLLSPYRDAA